MEYYRKLVYGIKKEISQSEFYKLKRRKGSLVDTCVKDGKVSAMVVMTRENYRCDYLIKYGRLPDDGEQRP